MEINELNEQELLLNELTADELGKKHPFDEKRMMLVVEDEPVNQEILKAYLNELYDVVIAGTGKEAMDIIFSQSEMISLILLDLNLPDANGLDILSKIQEDVSYASIPVIVMTADSDAEVKCLTLGAIDFIPKPYPRQEVVQARVLRTIELFEDRDILRWTERDHLTGLYNREFFYHYAVQFDIHNKNKTADAILVNIDNFHSVNERYGKAYGDKVLKSIGDIIKRISRTISGIAGRSEADHFIIYCTSRNDYSVMLRKISRHINESLMNEHRIRIRMGIYSNVDKTLDIERRFDRAKIAADTVKGNLTKTIGFFDDKMHEEELLAEQLIEDFSDAVAEGQFLVYYQPKYNIRSDEPVLSSAEALVRWKHPELGMVSPGVFIPLFEKNGLIQTLDNYVWAEAASKIREWKDRYGVSLPVSVNVSRIDLYDPGMVDKVMGIIEDNELSCKDLMLEITESAYTNDPHQIIDKVKQLRELGFLIEMDDFGSGYSSLNMLSSLPIDALKLDMKFIKTAFTERKDTRLIEIMIQLAKTLEVPTIAEGVETLEQMSALKSMGCDIIQGYFFSAPLPADEFERNIIQRRPENDNK